MATCSYTCVYYMQSAAHELKRQRECLKGSCMIHEWSPNTNSRVLTRHKDRCGGLTKSSSWCAPVVGLHSHRILICDMIAPSLHHCEIIQLAAPWISMMNF
jgi:hypothetical protein